MHCLHIVKQIQIGFKGSEKRLNGVQLPPPIKQPKHAYESVFISCIKGGERDCFYD